MAEPVLKDYGNEKDVGNVDYYLSVVAVGVLSVTRKTSVPIVE